MNHLANGKAVTLFAPATATLATNASSYAYLDTIGWSRACIVLQQGTGATSAAAYKVLKVTEGTNSTAASAIVALTGGSATSDSVGFVITNYNSTGGTIAKLDIDLSARKRYLRVQANVGAANTLSGVAILTHGKPEPVSGNGDASIDVSA